MAEQFTPPAPAAAPFELRGDERELWMRVYQHVVELALVHCDLYDMENWEAADECAAQMADRAVKQLRARTKSGAEGPYR